MNIQELLTYGGGIVLALLSLVEIAPIKVNPWSALAKIIGRGINSEVLKDLGEVKAMQAKTQSRLDEHIRMDDERYADELRARILQFDNELRRYIMHDEEDFIEALAIIETYEKYCNTHSEYHNSRALRAIANTKREYQERLERREFS